MRNKQKFGGSSNKNTEKPALFDRNEKYRKNKKWVVIEKKDKQKIHIHTKEKTKQQIEWL